MAEADDPPLRARKLNGEEKTALQSELRKLGATEIKENGKTIAWQLKFGPKVLAHRLPFAVERQKQALANPDEFKPRSKDAWSVPQELLSCGWRFGRDGGVACLFRKKADGEGRDCVYLKKSQDIAAAVHTFCQRQDQKKEREQAKRKWAEAEARSRRKLQKIKQKGEPQKKARTAPPVPNDQEDSEGDEDPRELLARALDNMTDFDVDTIRLSASQMTTVKNIAMGAKLKGTPRAKQTARSAEKHGSQAEKQVPQGGIYPEWIMNPNEPPCQFMTQSEKRAVQEKIQMLEVDQLDILMDWVNSRFYFEDKNNIDLDLDELPPSQQKEVVKLVENLFETVSRGDPKPGLPPEVNATSQGDRGAPVGSSPPEMPPGVNATGKDIRGCELPVGNALPGMRPEPTSQEDRGELVGNSSPVMPPEMKNVHPMQQMATEVQVEAANTFGCQPAGVPAMPAEHPLGDSMLGCAGEVLSAMQ